MERILVVDDARTVRELLRLVLEEAGYEVTTAASASAACAAMAASEHQLVIVDKNLEDGDGFSVCRTVRARWPGVACIVVTADQSVESAIQAVEEDVHAYMTKPLRKQAILLRTRRALDGVQLLREREHARAEMQAAKEALERRSAELERTLDRLLETQTRLVESEKLVSVGMLAAGVAHEINNPTCFILPNLEYLRRSADALAETAARCGAERVADQREHMHRMIDRCLEGVTRIQGVVATLQLFSRRDLAEPEPVSMHSLCLDLLDLVNHELAGRARLDVALQPVPPVLGRPRELAQVVLNLLLNARRSVLGALGSREHAIRVTTEELDGHVILGVHDTGPPLVRDDEDPLNQFFVSAEDVGGPGLSLRLVREILDRHQGRLAVHSSPDGNLLQAHIPLRRCSVA